MCRSSGNCTVPTRATLKNKDLDENIANPTLEKQKPSAPTEGF